MGPNLPEGKWSQIGICHEISQTYRDPDSMFYCRWIMSPPFIRIWRTFDIVAYKFLRVGSIHRIKKLLDAAIDDSLPDHIKPAYPPFFCFFTIPINNLRDNVFFFKNKIYHNLFIFFNFFKINFISLDLTLLIEWPN